MRGGKRRKPWTEPEQEKLLEQWRRVREIRLDLMDILPLTAPELEAARVLQGQLRDLYREVTGHDVLPEKESI